MRIGMRDVQRRVRDLTHSGQPLDVERVVGDERT
jgi:hypothetical protein